MNLLEVYNLLATNEITKEQAAVTYGMNERELNRRLGHWGHRLPLLLATLDKIKKDEISRETAAETLDCSIRQVNKLMESWQVKRPLKTYLVDKAAAQVKWEIRKKFAIDFIAGSGTIEDAAESAGVSTRQMRRWVSDLLDKHFAMVFRDLAKITDRKRKQLADEIETAENLEYAKQQMLKSIADGKISIQEEALNRVMSKRQHIERRRTNA